MRIILISLMLLLLANTHGQEVLFEGEVLDHNTGSPIPYVNLSFLNTLKGTSTDEQGHFFLDIPEILLEKQVHISSLGYKDTILNARQIFELKQINLREESFELDEVVLSENLGNSDVLNPISSRGLTNGFSSSSTPWVLALYFPNIGAQGKYIDKITVFFQKNNNFKRASSKFRLRIYQVETTTKSPGKDLLKKSMVLESNSDEDYVSIDLSDLHLKIPNEGIYIGLEWLFIPYNWYKKIVKHPLTNKAVVEDRFAPTFGGVYNSNQNFKAMVYGMGQWTDFSVKSVDREKNFIPAISLKVLKE